MCSTITRVVNKYKEDYDVYIGRGSEWGNPFTHIKTSSTKAKFVVNTREESIDKFRWYLIDKITSDPSCLERLKLLKGKRLGCFCKPKSCHGDILKEVIDSL